jgi:hypothetical protein
MKLPSILVAAGLAAVGALGVATTPALAKGSGYTCHGTLKNPGSIPGGTYSSLTMPKGSVCGVNGDVTVTHPVTVSKHAGLAVFSGSLTIQGEVKVEEQGVLASFDNSTPVDIWKSVSVGHNAAFIIGTESPGDPQVNSIGGPVTGKDESTVQIHNADVGGPVTLTGGGGHNTIVDAFSGGFPGNFNDLEDNVIQGAVAQKDYKGVWTGVIRDVIHGSFTFNHNREKVIDEYDIGSDTIYGSATCDDNRPAPNLGSSPGGPSTVFGPTLGDQAATCTSA